MTLPRQSRRGLILKERNMRSLEEEPRGGSIIWLMAIIVICLAPSVDTTVADIVVTAQAIWTMKNNRR